ncbi:MAG: GyrI-like domain-containing protein [Candidatus Riflebacteria bacterium]|nr:GyrI-like domain-containing protein [Candidatus Riflebacteria bacterium]
MLVVVAVAVATAMTAGAALADEPLQAGIRPVDAFNYICLPCYGPYTTYPTAVAAFLAEVRRWQINPTGPLMTIYWNSPLEVRPEWLRWEIAYPVAEGKPSVGNLVVKRFTYPRIATATHRGPYLTTYRTVNALYRWIAARGIKTFGGPCVEFYPDRDSRTVPADRKTTLIAIPVRSNRSALFDEDR